MEFKINNDDSDNAANESTHSQVFPFVVHCVQCIN